MTATAAAFVLSGVWAGVAQASDQLGYVTNEQAGTVTQVDLSTGTLSAPITVGSQPVAIAITPDGSTAYVADYGSSRIVPVALATGRPEPPITLSDKPNAIAITPDGRTAYVIADNGRVWPITLATGHVGSPTRIPANSDALAILPNGGSAYFTNVADGTLTPFTLSSEAVGVPINLSSATPDAVAITPDGSTAYIASNSAGTLTPLTLASGASGTAIGLGAGTHPTSVAISSDGITAYVTDFGTAQITPVTLATGAVGAPIGVAAQPSAIALVPASGITNAPPPTTTPTPTTTTTTGTSSTGSGTGNSKSTLGNQQLTLKVTPNPVAASRGGGSNAQVCYARRATVSFRLTRKTIRHAAKLRFSYVTFTLGKESKKSKKLPATAHFPLRGLSTGVHTLNVKAFFTESLARAGKAKGQKRKLTVTLSKTIKQPFSVC
ncbi:MAG TPA: YncE family protein [Solirubrobacteraceae bacterium]|nr:YncE family protein [Solirubrobacteraceae bacterium]